jgi:hypothetical protein
MLDVERRSEPTAAQVAAHRMACQNAKIPAPVADVLMKYVDEPATMKAVARAIGPQVANMIDFLTHGGRGKDEAQNEAATLIDGILERNPDMSVDGLTNAMVDAHMAIRREQAGTHDRNLPGAATVRDGFEAGPGFRAKMIAALTKRLDPSAETGGYNGPGLSVGEIAMTIARKNGLQPFNEAEAVQMAMHTGSDFPLILDASVANTVARRIGVIQPAIQRASHEMARADYRQGRVLDLSATAKPQLITEAGEIKFVTADEKGELAPRLQDYGAGFAISNQALTNDMTAVNLLNQIGSRMAEGWVQTQRDILLAPLLANAGAGQTMADGKAMFHVDHGNLAASGGALSITTLSAARRAMRRQLGMRGEIRAIEPWALVVPPELETVAQQLLADIAAATTADVNPFSGTLELIVEAGLTSQTAWYVCADPSRYDGLAHAYLEGQRNPRVESRPAWSTIGMEMRLLIAFDAKFVETATWYRNPGA